MLGGRIVSLVALGLTVNVNMWTFSWESMMGLRQALSTKVAATLSRILTSEQVVAILV